MRKAVIIFSALAIVLIVTYFLLFYRTVKFPEFEYDHVAVLSVDRAVMDTASDNYEDEVLVVTNNKNGTDGASFLDSKGVPLHPYYTRTEIPQEVVDDLHDCLEAPSGFSGVKQNECYPFYRDAIVYYDRNNNPVGWISLCFQCDKIYFSPKNELVTNESFDRIRSLFKRNGLFSEKEK